MDCLQRVHRSSISIISAKASSSKSQEPQKQPMQAMTSKRMKNATNATISSTSPIQIHEFTKISDICEDHCDEGFFKGWLNDKLVARLRVLQGTAKARKEMHSSICEQRDDWNKLFTATVRIATVSAAMLAAGSAASPAAAMVAAPLAALLDLAAAAVLAAVSTFQPSQLAEEQRTASRLYERLYGDIETTLAVDLRFREHSASYLREKLSRLHAIDAAFPLPLTPGGLPKFPGHVVPPRIGESFGESLPVIRMPTRASAINGWTWLLEEDLLRMSNMLRAKDVERYVGMARIMVQANRVIATAAPMVVAVASAANFAQVAPLAAGVLSVAAFFASCLSNDLQLGMVFEMYRNCAGYYGDVDAAIQRMLRMPVEMREDGELFHQRITHSIGRRDEVPSIPVGAQDAGIISLRSSAASSQLAQARTPASSS